MPTFRRLDELISLRGKRVLITGASSGIGKAMTYRFAEAGANLDLVDIDTRRLEILKDKLGADRKIKVNAHHVDLSSRKEIDALWENLDEATPDILVNNAGIYPFKQFLDMDEGFYRGVMDTNLGSVLWMCQQMIRRRKKIGGVIINVASIEAVVAFKADMAHYAVSKAGVIALTRALAKDYARRGFRVNALLPGGIITRGTKTAAKQILRFKFGLLKTGYDFQQRLPIGRAGQPDEVARMAIVLASDLAAYVHGATIPVDGGFLAA